MTKISKYLKIGSIEAIAYLLALGISFREIVSDAARYMSERLLTTLIDYGILDCYITPGFITNMNCEDGEYLLWIYERVNESMKRQFLLKLRTMYCIIALDKLANKLIEYDIEPFPDLRIMNIRDYKMFAYIDRPYEHLLRFNRYDILVNMYKAYDFWYPNITIDQFKYLFNCSRNIPITLYFAIRNFGDEIIGEFSSKKWKTIRMMEYRWIHLHAAITGNQQKCIDLILRDLPKFSNTQHLAINSVLHRYGFDAEKVYEKIVKYINRRSSRPSPSLKCAIRLLTQIVLYSDEYFALPTTLSYKNLPIRFFTVTAKLPLEIQTNIACIYGNISYRSIVIKNSDIWRELV